MLSIPNQLEGAYIGQDVTLECHTEAYPDSINYWSTEHGNMIVSGNFIFQFKTCAAQISLTFFVSIEICIFP